MAEIAYADAIEAVTAQPPIEIAIDHGERVRRLQGEQRHAELHEVRIASPRCPDDEGVAIQNAIVADRVDANAVVARRLRCSRRFRKCVAANTGKHRVDEYEALHDGTPVDVGHDAKVRGRG